MMLEGSCNQWGQFLCAAGVNSVDVYEDDKKTPCLASAVSTSGRKCIRNPGCQLQKMLTSGEDVQQNWINPEINRREVRCPSGSQNDMKEMGCYDRRDIYGNVEWWKIDYGVNILVGCASNVFSTHPLLRNRKKQSNLDIEILRQMLAVEAPTYMPKNKEPNSLWRYCAAAKIDDLRNAVQTKTLSENKMCINKYELNSRQRTAGISDLKSEDSENTNCPVKKWVEGKVCKCETKEGEHLYYDWSIKYTDCK